MEFPEEKSADSEAQSKEKLFE